MAELMLGVLAEDDNDCEVIRVLIRRIFEARSQIRRVEPAKARR